MRVISFVKLCSKIIILCITWFCYHNAKDALTKIDSNSLYALINLSEKNYHNHINYNNYLSSPSVMIRVKIFPHLKNYPPHKEDKVLDKIKILSNRKCKIFEGAKTSVAKTSRLLTVSYEINLNAKTLKTPLWIECPYGFYLTRLTKDVESYSYGGFVYVTTTYNKTLNTKHLLVINIINIEEYLKGVVPSEVFVNWPMETLKAQAVAARTYAMFHMNYSRNYLNNQFYDLDDTIAYQVYTGLSYRTSSTDFAVNSTKSEVLVFNGSVIQAFYHADSGGELYSAKEVFKLDVPYAQAQKELYLKDNEKEYSWKKTIRLNELTEALIHKGQINQNQYIIDMQVDSNNVSYDKIVSSVLLTLNDGSYKSLSLDLLKQIIFIPSSRFEIIKSSSISSIQEHVNKSVDIIGYSMGHRVGMSQIGAKILADKYSYSYDKILKFYYKDTKLCKYVNINEPYTFNLCESSDNINNVIF